jgi:hypothetical protein
MRSPKNYRLWIAAISARSFAHFSAFFASLRTHVLYRNAQIARPARIIPGWPD